MGGEISAESCNCFEMWWPGTELNRRRQPFQGCALPPELPGHVLAHSLSAGAVRPRLAGLRLNGVVSQFGQSDSGSVWNREDYSNGVQFTQWRLLIECPKLGDCNWLLRSCESARAAGLPFLLLLLLRPGCKHFAIENREGASARCHPVCDFSIVFYIEDCEVGVFPRRD